MARTRVLIAGAAGRDFHNFNLVYRDRPEYEVVAFTATQIPTIDGRRYPPELAGSLYPEGIPILPEAALEELIREHEIDSVVFAYSDVTHEHVMHIGSRALAAGASYHLIAPADTMLESTKPSVAICAVRTGSGKSQTTRHVARLFRESGKRVAVLRHPMPYGDLASQAGIDAVLNSIHDNTTHARVVLAASPFEVEGDAEQIRGKRVLAIEDGPTLTHGEMTFGAAVLAAKQHGAAELVDPRPFAVGTIAETFEQYPDIGTLLPAMGYGRKQMQDLRETIERSDADLVLIGTPIDLRKLIELDKPALRVTYKLQEMGEPTLKELLAEKGLLETALV